MYKYRPSTFQLATWSTVHNFSPNACSLPSSVSSYCSVAERETGSSTVYSVMRRFLRKKVPSQQSSVMLPEKEIKL